MSENCEHKWVKNGTRNNRKSGLVQRWVCTKCRRNRKDYEHDPIATRVQALALVARRLSFDNTEDLTGIKSESIHKDLRSVVADPTRWAETREKLSQLGLNDQELDYLHSIVWTAGVTGQRLQPAGPKLSADRAEVKRRIESIIGCEVVIGRSRQGVRVCRKRDFTEFIARIRALPLDRLATAKRLSPKELRVLQQLHTPNAKAEIFSMFQSREYDPVTRRLLPPKPSMKSLADGLNMEVSIFLSIAIALVRKLRRLTGPDHT